jgi:hypothetical protein
MHKEESQKFKKNRQPLQTAFQNKAICVFKKVNV